MGRGVATGGGTGAGGLLGPAVRGFALAFRAIAASGAEAECASAAGDSQTACRMIAGGN